MFSQGDRVVKYNVIPTGFKTSGGLAIGNMNLNNYFAPSSLDVGFENMTIYILGGTILLSKSTILDVSSQISPTFSAPGGSNKRIDLLWVDVNGILHIKQGTATTGTPEIPTIDSAITNQGFPICFVYLRGSSSQIKSSDDSTNNYIYADLRFALANNFETLDYRFERLLGDEVNQTDILSETYLESEVATFQYIATTGVSTGIIYKKAYSVPSIDKTTTATSRSLGTSSPYPNDSSNESGIYVDASYIYILNQHGSSLGAIFKYQRSDGAFSNYFAYTDNTLTNITFSGSKAYPFGIFYNGTSGYILNPNGLYLMSSWNSGGFELGSVISFSTPYTLAPMKMNITKIDSTNFYLNEIGTTLIKKVNTSGTMSASQTMKAGIKATIKIGSDFYAIINGTGANSELQKITI